MRVPASSAEIRPDIGRFGEFDQCCAMLTKWVQLRLFGGEHGVCWDGDGQSGGILVVGSNGIWLPSTNPVAIPTTLSRRTGTHRISKTLDSDFVASKQFVGVVCYSRRLPVASTRHVRGGLSRPPDGVLELSKRLARIRRSLAEVGPTWSMLGQIWRTSGRALSKLARIGSRPGQHLLQAKLWGTSGQHWPSAALANSVPSRPGPSEPIPARYGSDSAAMSTGLSRLVATHRAGSNDLGTLSVEVDSEKWADLSR